MITFVRWYYGNKTIDCAGSPNECKLRAKFGEMGGINHYFANGVENYAAQITADMRLFNLATQECSACRHASMARSR
jgi:hypothetical protein